MNCDFQHQYFTGWSPRICCWNLAPNLFSSPCLLVHKRSPDSHLAFWLSFFLFESNLISMLSLKDSIGFDFPSYQLFLLFNNELSNFIWPSSRHLMFQKSHSWLGFCWIGTSRQIQSNQFNFECHHFSTQNAVKSLPFLLKLKFSFINCSL